MEFLCFTSRLNVAYQQFTLERSCSLNVSRLCKLRARDHVEPIESSHKSINTAWIFLMHNFLSHASSYDYLLTDLWSSFQVIAEC